MARGRRFCRDLPADLVPTGPWQVQFGGAVGSAAQVELAIDELKSWSDLRPDSVRYFAGTARYRAALTVPAHAQAVGRRLTLDLGAVAEVAEVAINGVATTVLWKPPYRADVTGRLRPGTNRLNVAVTNLWHNRIVGDLRAPDAPAHANTNLKSRFRADMPLLPSGLFGPVVVRTAIEVHVPLH